MIAGAEVRISVKNWGRDLAETTPRRANRSQIDPQLGVLKPVSNTLAGPRAAVNLTARQVPPADRGDRRGQPRTAREIHDRLNEISFNGTLLRELRAVAFIQRLIEEGKLSPDEYKNVHLHRISKGTAEWDYFVQLRDARRRTAQSWLAAHYDAIGVRGTLDLQDVRL